MITFVWSFQNDTKKVLANYVINTVCKLLNMLIWRTR